MSVLLKKTVGEIAAAKPDAAALFEILGIDYSCHGNLSLRDACAAAGLDPVQVRKAIDQLPRGEEVNWLEQPVATLLRHLRDEEHPLLVGTLATASSTLIGECAACARHPEMLSRLRTTFSALNDTLTPHIGREDRVLYPVVEHLDRCWSRGDAPSMQLTGGVGRAIQSLMLEHGAVVMHLEEIDGIVDELAALPDCCREVVDELRDLSHLLREHIHLENNILFPRALALETAAAAEHLVVGGLQR